MASAKAPGIGSALRTPNNLPPLLTSFVGREREAAQLQRLLAEARVVTVTGAPGSGKTRLALEVASRVLDGYRDGVWLVRVRREPDADHMLRAVADALGTSDSSGTTEFIAAEGGRSLEHRVLDYLESKELLLILDACEDLGTEVASLIQTVRERAREVRVLVTSRLPLSLPGEIVWQVPPMPIPEEEPGGIVTAASIEEIASVQLFVDRARAVEPRFTLDDTTAPHVARICRRLDGLPLAIELTASRVEVIDVAELATRLESEFDAVVGATRAPAIGNETLATALDWAYRLVAEKEQSLFDRLAVFPEDFTLDAAEAVGSGAPIDTSEILDLLTGLVKSSLLTVARDEEGRARYRLLGILRSYALDRLVERKELAGRRHRHAEYYERLAEAQVARIKGPDQLAVLDRLEHERTNLRAALEYLLEDGDAAAALRVVSGLYWFWFVRNHPEGADLARRAVELAASTGAAPNPPALVGAALLVLLEGWLEEAEAWLRRAIAEAHGAAARGTIGEARMYLGMIAQRRGRAEDAEQQFTAALDDFRAAEDEWGAAWARWFLGTAARLRGDDEEAGKYLDASLQSFRLAGTAYGTANCLAVLGGLARARRDFARAEAFHREAQALMEAVGDRLGVAGVEASLGIDARERGDLRDALTHFAASVDQTRPLGRKSSLAQALYLYGDAARRNGDFDTASAQLFEALDLSATAPEPTVRTTLVRTLESLGLLFHDTGSHERAVTLLAAASSIEPESSRGSADRRRAISDTLTNGRARLGQESYEALWRAGRALSPIEATVLAHAEPDAPPAAGRGLSLDEVELGKRVVSELGGISERRELRLAGIRMAGRRRRPSGERAPIPRELRASGYFWIVITLTLIAVWVSLFAWPNTTEWWEARDQTVLDWFADLRRAGLTRVMEALHALGSVWVFRPLRWAMFVVLLVTRRWRHLLGVLVAFVVLESFVDVLAVEIGRPRPFVEIMAPWQGYSHPSGPVASLAVTLAVMGYSLIPQGRWRRRWQVTAAVILALLVVARVYLGVDHLTDGVIGALLGAAIAVLVFRLLVPDAAFPVVYRRGRTAHLDITDERRGAVRRAVADQLGLTVLELEPFGLEASGGSTPLRMKVSGEPDAILFGKLYSTNHLRADRWYKAGRTILYGSLEDEVKFSSVRRLVEYEDYMLLTMENAGVPSARRYGIVEITPEREYLIVTEFLADAEEISVATVDDSVIDDALLVIRKMWDGGLAHRDIKPANVMVQDGRVRLVDVAFGTVRPSPWRQAVDLANMMIILGLRVDPEQVYRRALRYFAPEDIAEAFAATRSVTIPSQSRSSLRIKLRTQGLNIIETYRRLAPHREPIAIQRWSQRRLALTLGALLLAMLLLSLIIENVTGRGFI